MANGTEPLGKLEREFDLEVVTETVSDLLRPHYLPAEGTDDADEMLTTAQLFALINDHDPELVPQNMIRQVLLGAGFSEGILDGTGFVWFLKRTA